MPLKFNIRSHSQGDHFHLHLVGHFDEGSAVQLLRCLRSCTDRSDLIFIDTADVTGVDPLGLNVFRYSLGDMGYRSNNIILTGRRANSLAYAWPNQRRPSIIQG